MKDMEALLIYITKWNRPVWADHILFDSRYVTSGKDKTIGAGKS